MAGFGDLRRYERISCKIRATLRYMGREARAAVLDVSEGGVRLYLGSDVGAGVGQQVTIDTDELGRLTGDVRWVRFPRMGVDLHKSSNTAAKITSYFKTIR
jgi:hypothetical protein